MPPILRSPFTRVAALALAWLVAGSGGAAAEGLVLDGRLGAGKRFRAGAWTAITLRAQNNGPSFHGTMRFVEPGLDGNLVFERPIELPRHSRKELTLYARIDTPADRYELLLVPDDRGEPISVPLDARLVPPDDRFVATIGPGGRGARALARRWTAAPTPAELTVTRIPPRELPREPRGLDGLDAVLWLAPADAPLDPPQLDVLATWVARGGHLIVAAGEDFGQLAAPPLAALLPLEPRERAPLPADEARALGARPGALVTRGPLASDAQVLIGAPRWPILARRAHGLGRVDLVTLHPERAPHAATPLATRIWEHALAPPDLVDAPRAAGALSRFPAPVEELEARLRQIDLLRNGLEVQGALSRLDTLEPVPLSWLMVLLAAYVLAIGPLDYLVLRRLGKLHWTWVSFPALIAIFTVLVWGLSQLNRSTVLTVSGLEVVDLAPDGDGAQLEAIYGLVSPSRHRLTLRAGDPGVLLDQAPWGGESLGYYGGTPSPRGLGASARSVQGDDARLEIEMRRFAISYARAAGGVEPPGSIDARLVRHADGQLSLALSGDLPLRDAEAHLLTGELAWDLGRITLPGDVLLPLDPTPASRMGWVAQARHMRAYRFGDDAAIARPWQLTSVAALTHRGVGVDLARRLAPDQSWRHTMLARPPGWGAGLDLGVSPVPVLIVDGGPLDASWLRIDDMPTELIGRRIYRIRIDDRTVAAAGESA